MSSTLAVPDAVVQEHLSDAVFVSLEHRHHSGRSLVAISGTTDEDGLTFAGQQLSVGRLISTPRLTSCSPRPLALCSHFCAESLEVNGDIGFFGELNGQLHGEPVGVVQAERCPTVQGPTRSNPGEVVLEHGEP